MSLALRETVRFTLIKACALTTKCCGHGAKSYTIWEEFTDGRYLVVQSKQKFMNMTIAFQLHTDDFIKHFPGVDFTTFYDRK